MRYKYIILYTAADATSISLGTIYIIVNDIIENILFKVNALVVRVISKCIHIRTSGLKRRLYYIPNYCVIYGCVAVTRVKVYSAVIYMYIMEHIQVHRSLIYIIHRKMKYIYEHLLYEREYT